MLNYKPVTVENLIQKIKAANWSQITEAMHQNGYAIIPGLLSNDQSEGLKENYNNSNLYRKTVVMERYRFGLGEYKYFEYPLPVSFKRYGLPFILIWRR